MTWNDMPLRPSTKMLRQFAVGWMVFFSAVGVYQITARGRVTMGEALIILGVVGGVAGWFKPLALRPVFVVWMVAAFPIGWCLSQALLAILFFGILTPVGWVMRRSGRDPLRRKAPSHAATLWHDRDPNQDVRRYFRQY